MPPVTRRSEREKQLRSWLTEHPDDLFLYQSLQRQSLGKSRDILVEEYARLLSAHPGDPRYLYLYGRALFRAGGKEHAFSQFHQAAKRDPRFPWSYLALAAYDSTENPGEVRKQLRRFWELCPDTLEAYQYVSRVDDDRFQREAAVRLRGILERRSDTDAVSYWGNLWALEFRLRPSPEHPALRKEIAGDLQHVRSLEKTDDKEWYRTLHEGYEMAGNKEEAEWAEKQFLTRFSYTDDALDWVTEKWMDEHHYPGNPKSHEAKAYMRELYRESAQWVKAWPKSLLVRFDRLQAAAGVDELPDREVLAVVDDFLRVRDENVEDVRGVPPFEFTIARIYLDRGIRENRVPQLIDETVRKEEERVEKDSQQGTEIRKMEESNLEYTRWASLPLLAEAYLKLGRTEDARKVVTRMEKMISDAASKEAAPPDSPAKRPKQGKSSGAMEESDADRALAQALHRAEAFRWKARIAEAEKHPADAWTYYRAGLLVMPAAEQQSREELEEDARRLWKKLGGTEEGWRTALERTPSEAHASVQEASGWEEKNLPLPDFEITDLSGRRWTRADLKGKVIFINVWATWCGPCQGELPHLQKLHEKLRGRSDVQLLTFNIDSNPGIVEPYITKRGYTFPTLPAEPYVLKFMGHVGIPRNWIVDRKGTLVSEQVGFGNQDDEQWAKEIVAQLDKVLASP